MVHYIWIVECQFQRNSDFWEAWLEGSWILLKTVLWEVHSSLCLSFIRISIYTFISLCMNMLIAFDLFLLFCLSFHFISYFYLFVILFLYLYYNICFLLLCLSSLCFRCHFIFIIVSLSYLIYHIILLWSIRWVHFFIL